MGRLASAVSDVNALLKRAREGDRVAALDLANTYGCQNVTELLCEVLCPGERPSVALFDVAADAMALKAELGSRKQRPVLKVK